MLELIHIDYEASELTNTVLEGYTDLYISVEFDVPLSYIDMWDWNIQVVMCVNDTDNTGKLFKWAELDDIRIEKFLNSQIEKYIEDCML